jgi:hypothetical protein
MPFDPNDPDTKAALKEAVEAAVEAAKGPLDAKNKELLSELKEAKKGKAIDPAEVERLEGKIEDLQGKLTAAEKAAKDAEKAREKAVKDLETESGFTSKLLIQDGLKSALLANGVKDEDFLDTLVAKFSGTASIVADGADRKVMLGDKPLADAIKEFAGSDSGKKFVSAPANGGGGAPGGGGGGSGKTMAKSAFDALPPKERSAFMASGGSLVDAAA